MTTRRRRGLLLLSVALASGGLAASEVRDREREVAERVGAPVEVLVAARDIPAGGRVARGALAVREVPVRFVPPDALASAEVDAVVGARVAVPILAGGYLMAAAFERPNGGRRGGGGLRRGERAVTVEVSGAGAPGQVASPPGQVAGAPGQVASAPGQAAGGLVPGSRVDVLVSTESGPAGGRTELALSGVELLRLAPAAPTEVDTSAPAGPSALATLRVTLREAVYLTEADNFARDIRLLARPGG